MASPTAIRPPRLTGFDVARSLAIFGMIIVHFMLVMTDGVPAEKWSDSLLHALDGRPAATFVILAGIGVSLISKRTSDPSAPTDRGRINAILRRRGVLLLACGFLNLVIWAGDILRIYGVSLLLIPWVLWRSSRTLLLTALAFVLVFCLMLAGVDYDRNWDWNTMTYHHLWTPLGLVRSLFYDGFRSVFPWTGLLLFGVWLGRLNWTTDDLPRKALICGMGLLLATSALSASILHWLTDHPQPGLDPQTANALFGLLSMPPLPLFLLNATGCALVVIGGCTLIERRWPTARPLLALAATGRMAFTWYVAHILLGLGGVIVLGWLHTSHWQALATATAFFALAVIASFAWRRRFANGPLEFLLREAG